MNLILCGLPMSGKTTIGKMLAEVLGWTFIDTDKLMEDFYLNICGNFSSCRQIFLNEGEAQFREWESQQIAALKDSTSRVIALGGGSLNSPINVKNLLLIGHIIYLDASPTILWERMKCNEMPAYLDPDKLEESFYALAAARNPLYKAAASFTIETTNLTNSEIVNAILSNHDIHEIW